MWLHYVMYNLGQGQGMILVTSGNQLCWASANISSYE